MVDIIELQHATMLSNRLELFKIKKTNPYKINFRCPICGDSKKSKSKARGWLLEDPKTQHLHFFCHNCMVGLSFLGFLKAVDLMVYNDFIAAKYARPQTAIVDIPKSNNAAAIFSNDNPLKTIKKVSQLPVDHPAKLYIQNRLIPPQQHFRLYYAPKFMSWINTIIPDKFATPKKDHPRLILPFIDKNGKCFGVSGRGFDPNGMRYITIMFDEKPKVFGLDRVNFDTKYYVTEGAIDSLFIPNTIAMAGAALNTASLEHPDNAVFVFDCEYRNKEIVDRMSKIIDSGFKICLMPRQMAQNGKDINEYILSGLTSDQIKQIIDDNTYKGLSAKLKLTELKAC